MRIPTYLIVLAYLFAIVASNLLVARYGQIALVFTAWVLIPFDLVARDILHGRWEGPTLWPRIVLLIHAGALITLALNWEAWRVAVASVTAFAVGTVVNTALFARWDWMPRLWRMTSTNSVVALIDSTLFPILAFGLLSWEISFLQFVSKSVGAYAWAVIVNKAKLT